MNDIDVLQDICDSYADEIKRLKLDNDLLRQMLSYEQNIGKKFRAALLASQMERKNLCSVDRNSDAVFGGIKVYENNILKDDEIIVTF